MNSMTMVKPLPRYVDTSPRGQPIRFISPTLSRQVLTERINLPMPSPFPIHVMNRIALQGKSSWRIQVEWNKNRSYLISRERYWDRN